MAQASTLYIGLDVHKETIAVAYVSTARTAEVRVHSADYMRAATCVAA